MAFPVIQPDLTLLITYEPSLASSLKCLQAHNRAVQLLQPLIPSGVNLKPIATGSCLLRREAYKRADVQPMIAPSQSRPQVLVS